MLTYVHTCIHTLQDFMKHDVISIKFSYLSVTTYVGTATAATAISAVCSLLIGMCVATYVHTITNTCYVLGGDDYGDTDTTHYNVTFPAGTSCSSSDIPIIDDQELEDDETFRITIVDMSLPFGTRLGDDITAEVIIEANDSE